MNILVKRFLVTGVWTDKEIGTPRAKLSELNEGESKDKLAKGKPYAFADTDKTQVVDGEYTIGKIVAFNMTPVIQSDGAKTTIKL